jgi:fumarate hydratase, class II
MKIANDLRWMNSGTQAGLQEVALPALQPGSSIMPGKINPVIPEVVAMVAAQVTGNDVAITIGGQSGSFELNVMLPLIAHNLLQSITLLSTASRALADSAVAGLTPNREHMEELLERNPILVTALAPQIGYDRAAQIAKQALAENRRVRDVARDLNLLSEAQLAEALDTRAMTEGGFRGGGGGG